MAEIIQLAGCLISNEEGEVLLLHRNNGKHRQWELPGGKVEPGENPESAAVREIKEELGIDVKIEEKIGEKGFKTDDGIEMNYTWFSSKIIDGTPTIAEPETFDDIGFFSIKDMRAIKHE